MAAVWFCFTERNSAQANRLERERNPEACIRSEPDQHKLERMAAVRRREAPEDPSVAKVTVRLAFAHSHRRHCFLLSPLVWPQMSFLLAQSRCGASPRQPTTVTILMTTCPSVLYALVAVQEGVNCSFTWRHILYFHPWVHMLNVIFASVACLSETLHTSRFLR